jgi:hypothetical protein
VAAVTCPPDQPVVLSYGLGADSTALLLRWLEEPDSRDFDLDQLIVCTAMTGDEFDEIGVLVRQHILPRLAAACVRFVQVARKTASQRDGIAVLADTRHPNWLFLDGVFKLSDELTAAATVPQCGGTRLCSIHAKGEVLDAFFAQALGGRTFRHAIGFEVDEQRRADRDKACDTDQRTSFYPLIEWGWDRAACERYIAERTGVQRWPRSHCTYCPFALTNKAGRARMLARYDRDPEAGIKSLMLERRAICLNSNQGLVAGKRLADLALEAGHFTLLALFDARLAQTEHVLVEVRRILRPRKDDPTRQANASRHVRILDRGSRRELDAALTRAAAPRGAELDDHDGIRRAHLRRRGDALPALEHFLVVAPAGLVDKGDERFDAWWAEIEHGPAAAELFDLAGA